MSAENGSKKPSDTSTYLGENPVQTSGTLQTGGYNAGSASVNYGSPVPVSVTEGLPSATRAIITGPGVTTSGPTQTNQFQIRISLAGGPVQLMAASADCNNNPTSAISPNSFVFYWISRNHGVVTVSASGLLIPQGRGEAEVLCWQSRQVNANFAGAPTAGSVTPLDGPTASIQVTVLA